MTEHNTEAADLVDDETGSDEIEDAATTQPTLPDLELPTYNGRTPIGMKSALTGAGTRIRHPYGIGDRVVLVVEAKVKKAGHEETDDGLVYVETLKVTDLFELDRDPGTRLLRFLRSNYRLAEDKVAGRAPLADNGTDLGEEGWTDANGVLLTPAEVAERRGDPVAYLTGDTHTPAVIVYDDGSRLLWPDEFLAGFLRPNVGDAGENDRIVVELLHHATGETIARLEDDEFPAHEYDADGIKRTDEATRPSASPVAQMVTAHAELDDWEGAPADHRSVADDGGYGDVEPYDAPTTTPDVPALPGEEAIAAVAPGPVDFAFVDRPVPQLRERLDEVADLILVRRYLEAEKQGRGKGAAARRGALDAIHARIEVLEARQVAQ